jgi:DNA-binding CsgD family transcriptional regulator
MWSRDASAAVFSDVLLSLSEGHEIESTNAAVALVNYARQGAEKFDLGQMLVVKARVMIAASDFPTALQTLEELWELLSRHAYPYVEACAHEIASMLQREQGAMDEATNSLELALTLFEKCENQADLARCERFMAETLLAKGNAEARTEAREHLKRARGLAENSGALVELNRIEQLARALGLRLRSGRSKGSKSDSTKLSPREVEVAALVAEGETNARIAARLFLSDRTVQDHITHALKKLNLSSRAALASWAARNGLL